MLTGATDRLQHDVVEIELVVGERHTGVDPGQAVAVVDQPGQPLGVLAQRGELLAPRRVVVQCGDLELRAQGGHRGADLVGGVGDELPLPSGGGLGPAAEAVRRAAARAGLPADVVVEVTATVRPDGSMAPL